MRFVRAKRLVDDDVKRKSRWCVSVSVFEYLDATRETKSETTKVVLKMRLRIHTFKLFHLRVAVVMLQLFRQSFDSHFDDDECVFNTFECVVKVSEESRRW